MAISFVSSEQSTGSTLTIPAHQAGDFLLVWAFRNGSNSAPLVPNSPANPWTMVFVSDSTTANNSAGAVLAWKIAKSNAETFGTWTNATQVEVGVYRGVDQNNPVIAANSITRGSTGGSTSTIQWPACTAQFSDSWLIAAGAHRTSVDVNTPPTGFVNRINRGTGIAALAIHDNQGASQTFAGQNITANADGTSRTVIFELRTPRPASGGTVPKTFLVGASPLRYVGADKANRYRGAKTAEWNNIPVGSFNPQSLGPASWWDVSDSATITLLDGRVNRVLDKSGNGRQLLTVTASKQPIYNPADSRIRGKPSISATRPGDILLTQLEPGPTPNAYEVREIYIVAQYATGVETQFNTTNNNIGWGTPGSTGGDAYSVLFAGGGNLGSPRIIGNFNSNFLLQAAASFSYGIHINRDIDDRGHTTQQPILPMPLCVIRAVLRDGITASDITSLRAIGNQDASSVRAWGGPWCECLMFQNPLAVDGRVALIDYLISKWGIIA